MRGRKPKPTKLKIVEGNPGKRPLPTDEPAFSPASIEPPVSLRDPKNAHALEEWNRVAPLLSEIGLLTEGDRTALTAYCTIYQRWVSAEQQILKEGVFREFETGYVQVNPYVTVANRSLKQMKEFMIEFGLTPSSRVRLGGAATTPGKRDSFSEFLDVAKNRS